MSRDENRVRERAYYIWEDEGRIDGRAEAHWFQAEAELNPAPVTAVAAPVVEAQTAQSPAKVLKPRAPKAKSPAKAAAAQVAAAGTGRTKAAAAAKSAAKPRARRATTGSIALH
ncbi:DUF2934 domain-containing protein [Methylobacterium organophilum]|uniref:DUF2934 domain-containing protein n=1 Tax=Methylobacterium organophilum TaxID=410 RepID=UPI001F131034|nr:DUF2934 domain-containing protein [Methylobacterium organophilum]UMY16402.1 DUF2934 domain-containing protein [Methylobacterium organophilum]